MIGRTILRIAAMIFISAAMAVGLYLFHAGDSKGQETALKKITLDEAKILIKNSSVLFIDARSAEEFALGHIPNSLSLPNESYEQVYPLVKKTLAGKKTLITYCGGESCGLSELLGKRLAEEGFRDVRIFFGGWPAWLKEGLPIETGKASWKENK